jgi:hypothetical protein
MTARRPRRRGALRRRDRTLRPVPAVSPLPPPEEVFLDWLVSMADCEDIEAEARLQAEQIADRAPRHADAQCLRSLLLAVAGERSWPKPVANL